MRKYEKLTDKQVENLKDMDINLTTDNTEKEALKLLKRKKIQVQ